MQFRHNNFLAENDKAKIAEKAYKKKLPNINENSHKSKGNSVAHQKNMPKDNFVKTMGNFYNSDKIGEIREIKSQAGSDILLMKKTDEVIYFRNILY